MKKLLIIKAILLVVALCLISLFASCSPEETPTPQEQAKTLDVTIEGNSPEFWYHNAKTNVTTKYTQSHIVLQVNKYDTITAIGYGYEIDNSNNYGAPNVTVIGYITFKVNGAVVKNGTDVLYYQIQ
jgi:cytochrome oxidase Cu insertion factor (SCO1/SenC/PrrC family)